METKEFLEHERQQQAIEQELNTKQGYEFYEHSLNLDKDRRKTEGERELARLKALTPLTEEEEEILIRFAPPVPDFDVVPEQQIREMGYFKGKTPRKRLKSYKERREEWEGSEDGITYKNTVQRIEDRERSIREYEERIASITGVDGEPLFKEVKADPKDMHKALMKMNDDRNFATEENLSSEDFAKARSCGAVKVTEAIDAFTAYMNGGYTAMNDYFRTGKMDKKDVFSYVPKYVHAENLKKIMDVTTISRDMVVRRGVAGFDTIKYMIGTDDVMSLSGEELKAALKKKMGEGDLFVRDKGFVSTSIRAGSGFGAGGPNPTFTEPGIEFIILVKKGTHALDISNAGVRGQAKNEDELLINAGTKFRVVKVYFNDGEDKDTREEGEILMGNKQSWKIYLETIPGSDDGELR